MDLSLGLLLFSIASLSEAPNGCQLTKRECENNVQSTLSCWGHTHWRAVSGVVVLARGCIAGAEKSFVYLNVTGGWPSRSATKEDSLWQVLSNTVCRKW